LNIIEQEEINKEHEEFYKYLAETIPNMPKNLLSKFCDNIKKELVEDFGVKKEFECKNCKNKIETIGIPSSCLSKHLTNEDIKIINLLNRINYKNYCKFK
jgi:hypothetical protein